MSDFLSFLPSRLPELIVVVIFSIIVSSIPRLWGQGSAPVSYKIAIVGLPGAGKTTLIAALFELIQRGDFTKNVKLRGEKTISRANIIIALLKSGKPVGPTKERDTFLFRFSFIKSRLRLFRRAYDVEIADFPGEYSKKILQPTNESVLSALPNMPERAFTFEEEAEFILFDKEFFSWIATAQHYVFVVDLSDVYRNENSKARIAEISARVRASWQIIEDAVSERGVSWQSNHQVHIVFSKADCFSGVEYSSLPLLLLGLSNHESDIIEKVGDRGQSPDLDVRFVKKGVQKDILELVEHHNNVNFDDLIVFFKNRKRLAGVIYTSVILEEDGRRLGIRELLLSILP